MTLELLKQALAVRTGRIKGFLVSPNASGEQVNVLLTKVSSHDIQSFVEKLDEIDGINAVSTIERKRGDQLSRLRPPTSWRCAPITTGKCTTAGSRS